MKSTIEEIAQVFEEECNCEVEIISASSGVLTNQISNGAPFDVFLSASMKYTAQLSQQDLIEGPVLVFAEGKLVIWSMDDRNVSERSLLDPKIGKIAIANPDIAPFGTAAMEFLATQDYLQELRPKLVFGENVGQTDLYITSGSADIGITSKASAYSYNEGYWYEIDSYKYGSLLQTCAVLKNSKQQELALKFQNFLGSEKAKEILVKNGYDMPGPREF